MPHPLFERHAATLDRAETAIAERGYWSAFPESPSPKVYGEGAADAGKAAFDALRDKPFALDQPGTVGTVGREVSPYGFALGITYPKPDVDALFAAVAVAEREWRNAGPETWVGVCAEILHRINRQSFLIANAVMHTTGQAFMMAFQAGGPACAGPRARGRRLRVGRAAPHSGQGVLGEAAGQERAAEDGEALSHRAARHRRS